MKYKITVVLSLLALLIICHFYFQDIIPKESQPPPQMVQKPTLPRHTLRVGPIKIKLKVADPDVIQEKPVPEPRPESDVTSATKNDEDDYLKTSLRAPLPSGLIKTKILRDDGTIGIAEEFDGGPMVYRNMRTDGLLIGESIQFQGGDRVDRMYDDSGNIKGIAWSRVDGSRTDALYSNGGTITGKTDLFPDGGKVITRYDDLGNPIGRWQALPGGQWGRID